jgi:hypothetical protein
VNVEYLLKTLPLYGVPECTLKNSIRCHLSCAGQTKKPSPWNVKFEVSAAVKLTATFGLSGCNNRDNYPRDDTCHGMSRGWGAVNADHTKVRLSI